jgi:formate hydrogenlyase subunit 3/multisubunit Na+/H+ antiporter MnhD subunit
MNSVIALAIVVPIALCAISLVSVRWKGIVALMAMGIIALVSSMAALKALVYQPLELVFAGNPITGAIPIRMDGLSAWFILTINMVVMTGALFGLQYMKVYKKQDNNLSLHWIALTLLHLALVMVCTVQNSVIFLISWEMMAVSTFLALIFEHDKVMTLNAGLNYLIQSHICIVLIMIGFVWVATRTGSFDFNAISTFTMGHTSIVGVILFWVFFIGFGFKAGFIPLHTWLPHAHPAAPSHISGIMSGVIVKMGIYGIFRVLFLIHTNFLVVAVLVLMTSMATGIYGILNAAFHRDIKRMLAYCTIENIGIIGIGISVGLAGLHFQQPLMVLLGFGGALLHVVNHALYKALLFFAGGSVYRKVHTRDMDKLGGLMKRMPHTSFLFLMGALAISGIPLFNGFVSEFLIYSGLLHGLTTGSVAVTIMMVLAFGALSMMGGLSILTFSKTFGTVFLGTPRSELPSLAKEVSWKMLLPQYLLVVVMMSVAFLPVFYLKIVSGIVAQRFTDIGITNSLIDNCSSGITSVIIASAAFLGGAGLLWFVRWMLTRRKPQAVAVTWGCAYEVPNERLQYTGKSFSKPLAKIVSFLVVEEKRYSKLSEGEVFPVRRSYFTNYLDFIELRIIGPLLQRLLYLPNYLKFIQNGKVQWYVLYGVIFILCVFLFTWMSLLWPLWQELTG